MVFAVSALACAESNDRSDGSLNDALVADACPTDASVSDASVSDASISSTWGTACKPTPGIDEIDENGFESYVDFVVIATGFDDYQGKAARVRTDQQEGGQVYGATELTVVDGGFTVTWPNAKERFTYQPFYGYVDVDEDGLCDPDFDLVWHSATNAFNSPDNEPFTYEFSDTSTWVVPANPTQADATCSTLNQC